jgi:galactoside O-acetyltransferase
MIQMGRWTFIGYNSVVFTSTEKYGTSLVNAWWGETEVETAGIVFEDYSGIASGVTVFPGVELPEGCAIGANSLVYSNRGLKPWTIYAGNPLREFKSRDKARILAHAADPSFLRHHG